MDSTLACDSLDELALLPDDDDRLLGAALEEELVALEIRAELGVREDIDLDASSLDPFANLVAPLLADLPLLVAILGDANNLLDVLGLAVGLPQNLAVVVVLDALANVCLLPDLRTLLVRNFVNLSVALRLADLVALLERAVDFLVHFLSDEATCSVFVATFLVLFVANRLELACVARRKGCDHKDGGKK